MCSGVHANAGRSTYGEVAPDIKPVRDSAGTRTPTAGKCPYVVERILVTEELLGRLQLDGETVHHRNGVRDDNRPEHLPLWTRPQPAGIRVTVEQWRGRPRAGRCQ